MDQDKRGKILVPKSVLLEYENSSVRTDNKRTQLFRKIVNTEWAAVELIENNFYKKWQPNVSPPPINNKIEILVLKEWA